MCQDTIPQRFRERIQEAREKQLEELDLSGGKLTQFPDEVFDLTHLKKLDLRNNNIYKIPSEIARLSNLECLDLIRNKELTEISHKLVEIPSLAVLRLTWNINNNIPKWFRQVKQLGLHIIDKQQSGKYKSIETIPDAIVNLKNLVFLKIWLKFSTDWIPWFKNLKELELNLSSNQLETLPESFSNLSNLTWLDLSSTQLATLPESFSNLSNLTWLNLSFNQLATLPESFSNLSSLTWLNLNSNQVKIFPKSATNLSNLTTLYLRSNQLETLPDSFSNLSNLTWLDLSSNQLETLPDSFSNLSNLTTLYLSDNQLSSLPEAIGNLCNLRELDLSSNQLETLPESFSSLSNLTTLYLSYNQLSSLPKTIGNLSNLSTVNLRKNQIFNLPESFSNLSNLTGLDFSGNPLEKPPLEIANKGIEAIKKYFLQLRKEGKDYIYEAKLLILGKGEAGKTTLAKKIEDPNYKLNTHEKSTEGIDITKWSFTFLDKEKKEREFKVNIWDFGGQEIYHATHQFFLTKRSLYALVVDTRREETDFYYWLNVVELLSNNSPLLIIKNEKGDRTIEIDINTLRGRFENLKESLSTNLATNRGLEQILAEINHNIRKLPHVGSALPVTWKRVRETLEEEERNYISLEEYLQICEDNGFKQLKDKLQLSGYLHDLGVCLHFQDSPLLKNTVILKPEWGTDAVYKVLDDKEVINNLGRFTTDDLNNIWSDEQYQFKQAELLELMMRFKLCYKIPGSKDTYIAPQLLTKTKPDYGWDTSNNLILRYTYEFMPKGIITQLIVAIHEHIYQQQYVWRSGVVFNKDDTLAEVIEHYDKREIKIRLAGKRKKDLLTIITHELDKIHGSYPRLKYRKLIPCICSECKNQQEPYFHPFDVLQKAKEKGQREVQCQKSFQMVNVLDLIDDVIIPHNPEPSDSTPNIPQPITKIEQHIHGNVGTLAENVEEVKIEGDRSVKIVQENDTENLQKRKRSASTNMTSKILVLASNSKGTNQLLLDQEIRDIEAAIRNASQGNLFSVKPQLAVRIQDLQPTLLREKPRIVHFCGHGTGAKGLIVQTASSESQLVNTSALANLFKQFSEQIECVILNACYSEVQAQVIHQHINYVIGTTDAIKDSVAILFSTGFYGALAEGRSIESAFELGLNRIELEIDSTHHLERKLVPIDSGTEHQYSDRSGNLVLTLLKKEPLNNIINEPTEVETMPSQSPITINQGNYNQQTGNNNTMTNVTQSHSGSGDNVAGDKNVNQSRSINISGGTINATGAGAFNLGDISGTVANTINQLPNSPNFEQPGIKELLIKLEEAISHSQELDHKRKTKALKQVDALAKAAQNPTDEEMKDSAEDATTILEKIVSKLPAAAALVTISKKVLPAISHFFGL